jgi:poly(3-hydroxybutyrate) depolymerase
MEHFAFGACGHLITPLRKHFTLPTADDPALDKFDVLLQSAVIDDGVPDGIVTKTKYEQITGAYCMDKARVFASGESSGGDFSSILGCEHADKLRAVAPCATKNVSQYPLTASTRKCTGQVASVVIHGKNDNVVGPENGPKTRDFYVALNHCGTTTMPVAGYSDTLSNCVEYQGCDAGYPVIWCQHTDPNYSNTNHGWPAFAPKYLFAMFSKL